MKLILNVRIFPEVVPKDAVTLSIYLIFRDPYSPIPKFNVTSVSVEVSAENEGIVKVGVEADRYWGIVLPNISENNNGIPHEEHLQLILVLCPKLNLIFGVPRTVTQSPETCNQSKTETPFISNSESDPYPLYNCVVVAYNKNYSILSEELFPCLIRWLFSVGLLLDMFLKLYYL